MASSSKSLFAEEIEQAFLEELTDAYPSDCSSDDDSSGTDDLAVGEVIVLECSGNKDDIVQGVAAPNVLSATFTWEDMRNYVGQRGQFVGNCEPQNEAKNKT
jgi:hypothetical protein